MPYSSNENRELVIDIVTNHIKPATILDIGAGSGTYSDLLRPYLPYTRFDAIEIWSPYVSQFDLTSKYTSVSIKDVRSHKSFRYDLVICGDVLEHMSTGHAGLVWDRIGREAKWGMISVPIVHYPQGAHEGNPHEEHVQDNLTVDEIIDFYGPFDYMEKWDVTATFFRKFR